jgi:hypothetical protein
LLIYGAAALTVFGLASLPQHLAGGSTSPAATEMTAEANRNQVRQ